MAEQVGGLRADDADLSGDRLFVGEALSGDVRERRQRGRRHARVLLRGRHRHRFLLHLGLQGLHAAGLRGHQDPEEGRTRQGPRRGGLPVEAAGGHRQAERRVAVAVRGLPRQAARGEARPRLRRRQGHGASPARLRRSHVDFIVGPQPRVAGRRRRRRPHRRRLRGSGSRRLPGPRRAELRRRLPRSPRERRALGRRRETGGLLPRGRRRRPRLGPGLAGLRLLRHGAPRRHHHL
mmetsp:Transcript_13885/g.45297  ORF Transcript_13885/g.45297 Transcript_13885/m.45297 type:complete len:236 (+) Transcript_13885:317-1024(+)